MNINIRVVSVKGRLSIEMDADPSLRAVVLIQSLKSIAMSTEAKLNLCNGDSKTTLKDMKHNS